MKIDFREFEGRVPVLTPPSSGQAFSLPFEFSIFFFRFRHREQGVKTESNFYHRSPVDEIVNAQLYNRGQFLSRTINFGILLLLLM